MTVVAGWILLLPGAALAVGGMWLATLGGSWTCIAMGIGLLVSGVLLTCRVRAGLGVDAPLLIATLSWVLWEIGLDRWRRYRAAHSGSRRPVAADIRVGFSAGIFSGRQTP